MSESIRVTLGDPLPLSLTLPDGAAGLFPRAYIRDSAGVAVGSPVDLVAASAPAGNYIATGPTPGAVGFFTAQFVVFSDGAHTIKATIYSEIQDSFTVVDVATPANVTAVITQGDSAWLTATGFATPANVTAVITQGDAAWVTATGFATPGDVVAGAALVTTFGGPGPWTTAVVSNDWTTGEREQIRFRLAMDGTQADPTTDVGTIEEILAAAQLTQLVESGRWKIDTTTNQMTFYAADKTTPLLVFNLFDASGNPTSTAVFERVPDP